MPVANIVYERAQFELDITNIKELFTNEKNIDFLLKDINYQENVPIEGLERYYKDIWEMITTNKNLFLPSEKKLISIYLCEGIKKTKIVEFMKEFEKIEFALTVKFQPKFLTQSDELSNRIQAAFTKETNHYDSEVFQKELKSLNDYIKQKIEVLCKEQIKKACRQAQSDYLRYGEELYKSKKFDNVHQDLRGLLNTVKNDTENRIRQCSYGNIDLEPLKELSLILENIFKGFMVKFLENYIRENENSLLRKFMRDFQTRFNAGIHLDFWANINVALQKIIEEFQKLGLYILRENFRVSEEESIEKIDKIIKNALTEIKDQMKGVIKGNIDSHLLKKLQREISHNEKGVPHIWKEEKRFLDVFDRVYNDIDPLLRMFKEFELILSWVGSENAHEKIIVFENDEIKEKKRNLEHELLVIKERTLNKIVNFTNNLFKELKNLSFFFMWEISYQSKVSSVKNG